MNRGDLIRRVRSYTRDLSASIFRTVDIVDFINEGADRLKSRINQLSEMPELISDDQVITYLPSAYHHLLAVYAASRCFMQDERNYQSSTLMNEFETKLEELFALVNDGTIVIKDGSGVVVESTIPVEYVQDVYFANSDDDSDIDDGVDGVN